MLSITLPVAGPVHDIHYFLAPTTPHLLSCGCSYSYASVYIPVSVVTDPQGPGSCGPQPHQVFPEILLLALSPLFVAYVLDSLAPGVPPGLLSLPPLPNHKVVLDYGRVCVHLCTLPAGFGFGA